MEEAVLHWSGKSVKAIKHTQLSTLIYINSFDLLMIIGLVVAWSAWLSPPPLYMYVYSYTIITQE